MRPRIPRPQAGKSIFGGNVIELKQKPIWLIWGRTPQGTKIPLWSSTGHYGLRWNDPDFLIGYDSALRAKDHFRAEGIGFVIPDGYCLLDIDNVALDSPALLELIQCIDSYAELSPSGKGVHILVKHGLGLIRNKVITTASGITIEIKPHTFSTYTDNIIKDSPIKDATEILKRTYYILEDGIEEKAEWGNTGEPRTYSTAYITAAITSECNLVRYSTKGSRTNTLLAAASRLGRFRDHLGRIEIELKAAAKTTGLKDAKIKATVKAGFAYSSNTIFLVHRKVKAERP